MASRKGSPNKLNGQAKENVAAVFTRIGGTDRMAKWAEDNLTEFYRIYAKLISTLPDPDDDKKGGNWVLTWQKPL